MARHRFKFAAIILGLGLGLLVGVIGLAVLEIILRRNHPPVAAPEHYAHIQLNEREENFLSKIDRQQLLEVEDPFSQLRLLEDKQPGLLTEEDFQYVGGGTYRQVLKVAGGPEILTQNYVLDESTRRPVPGSPEHSDTALLMLGDSTMFGEGLNDNLTIPAFVQSQLRNIRVISAAYRGLGANDHLAIARGVHPESRLNRLYGGIGAKRKIAVYGFMPGQLPRMSCTLACWKSGNAYLRERPRFKVVGGKLEYQGVVSGQVPLANLLSVVANSEIVSHFKIDWPDPQGDRSLAFQFKLLDALRTELKNKMAVDEFYLFFFPNVEQLDTPTVDGLVEKYGFKVIDGRGLSFSKILAVAFRTEQELGTIPFNGHWSGRFNFLAAQLILNELKTSQ